MVLEASFVKHRQRRDRIYVRRQDGTSVSWDFPSYGDGLPHDLIHLVVENGLGLDDGFWGLIDGGVDVTLIDNQATLVGHGTALADQPGVDLSGLDRAEQMVAMAMRATADPAEFDQAEAIKVPDGRPVAHEMQRILTRLRALGQQWQNLDDGTAIILTFDPSNAD
jgi:hypothetical protein